MERILEKYRSYFIFLLLICLPFSLYSEPFSVFYHGAPAKFEQAELRPSQKIDENDHIEWEGDAIFAAKDIRVALFYTHDKTSGFKAEIDLKKLLHEKEPIIYTIEGPSEEEVLEGLWGPIEECEDTFG